LWDTARGIVSANAHKVIGQDSASRRRTTHATVYIEYQCRQCQLYGKYDRSLLTRKM